MSQVETKHIICDICYKIINMSDKGTYYERRNNTYDHVKCADAFVAPITAFNYSETDTDHLEHK